MLSENGNGYQSLSIHIGTNDKQQFLGKILILTERDSMCHV